jgi:hypothetical protein
MPSSAGGKISPGNLLLGRFGTYDSRNQSASQLNSHSIVSLMIQQTRLPTVAEGLLFDFSPKKIEACSDRYTGIDSDPIKER